MQKEVILVVDDEFEVLNRIILFLVEAFPEYEILNASGGDAAWQLVRDYSPNLVLTDWDMPELNGIQLTQLMQSEEELKEVPVILMTGSMTASTDLKEALEAGTVDYVRKPLDFIELKARMNAALKMYKTQQQVLMQHQQIQNLMEAEAIFLQKELEAKSRQLSASTLLAVEKNYLFERILQELKATSLLLKEHPIRYHANKLLQNELKSQNRIDTSWNNFKKHFEEVHPSFFQELLRFDVKLTPQDIKLSAYLKLGLGTKEIATLMGITTNSVRKSTYRLKKKFKLSEEANLRMVIAGLG